jgi:transglutaminase-like putative cysteine protease
MKAVYQLTRPALLWQLLMVVAVLLPHSQRLPWWLPLMTLGALGWRLWVHLGRTSFPHWSVKFMMAVTAGIGVVMSIGRGNGPELAVALLFAGFSLKLLEIYKRRDALVLIYVAYFLAATELLFGQSLLHALYIALVLVLITAALNSVYQSERHPDFWRPLRASVRLLLPALPLMVVLFVLVPRIGPIWYAPLAQEEARTGLSDTLSPGDVSRLTGSSDVAFRVQFDNGRPPPASSRYWRGLTYDRFDGRRWEAEADRSPFESPRSESGTLLRYNITQEPSGQPWVYALDYPVAAPWPLRMQANKTLRAPAKIRQRMDFALASRLSSDSFQALTAAQRERYLVLPEGGNERARALALSWRTEDGSTEGLVARALALYARVFRYTLTPQRLGDDSIDDFLFDTQEGFCGHFASSLTFLLRAAGVPTRIVGGYLGGEWNPYESYLVVRQFEAHAWTEVWHPGRGWVRVDPTAAVAPERIEQSAEQLLSSQPGFLSDTLLSPVRFGHIGWINALRMRADALNFVWHRWVLSYQLRQNDLLQKLLGEVTLWKLALGLLIPFSLVLGWVALGLLRQRRPKTKDPVDAALLRLIARFESRGLGRKPGEPVGRYAQRIALARPDLAPIIGTVARLYEQLRYAEGGEPQLHRAYLAAVRACVRQL